MHIEQQATDALSALCSGAEPLQSQQAPALLWRSGQLLGELCVGSRVGTVNPGLSHTALNNVFSASAKEHCQIHMKADLLSCTQGSVHLYYLFQGGLFAASQTVLTLCNFFLSLSVFSP